MLAREQARTAGGQTRLTQHSSSVRRIAARIAAIFALSLASACSGDQFTVTVDPAQTHQTIAGWEATARLSEFDKAGDRFDGGWLAQRDAIFALLVDQAGIDRLRLEIRSGAENPVDYWSEFASRRLGYNGFKAHFYEKINDNADPFVLNPVGIQFSELDWRVENIVLPVKARVEARGRRFHLNLNYVDFRWTAEQGSLSHADNPEEYAELIVAAFDHLRDRYGLVPDSLEIVLEPDNSVGWRGPEIGRAIAAVSRRLAAAGYGKVPIIAPSTAKAGRALPYLDGIDKAPGAIAAMTTLSYHRYEGEPDASLLHAIRDTARRRGMTTAMLEYVDGDLSDLIADLTEADATAWQLFGIAGTARRDGAPRPGWLVTIAPQPSEPPMLGLSPVAAALALVFDNVEPGSVRIGTTSNSRDIGVVGFRTPAGRLVVVVDPRRNGTLALNGLPAGRYALVKPGGAARTVDVAQPGNFIVGQGKPFALIGPQPSAAP